MTAPTVVHHDETVTEHAVLCVNGAVHVGPRYINGAEDAERTREVCDGQSLSRLCGGNPHVVASRQRTTTAWMPS